MLKSFKLFFVLKSKETFFTTIVVESQVFQLCDFWLRLILKEPCSCNHLSQTKDKKDKKMYKVFEQYTI